MISLDPANRPSFETLLHNARGTIFPESFYSFLHSYVASMNELPSSSPFSGPASSTPASVPLTPTVSTASNATLKAGGTSTPVPAPPGPGIANGSGGPLPSDADHRIERIWADYESMEPYVLQGQEDEGEESVRTEYASSARPYQVLLSSCTCSHSIYSTLAIGRFPGRALHSESRLQAAQTFSLTTNSCERRSF